MKKILFPTDFSETSFNAFKYALELANFIKAEILILHAYESKTLSSSRLSPKTIDDFKENIELKEFENFRSHVNEFRDLATAVELEHISFKFVLEYGYLLPIIQNKVKEENIDLIVMGTNNDKDFETSILGTNTYNVIINTEIPTLCVPRLATYKKIKTMAFSTTFSPNDEPALEFFMELAQDNKCEAKCIYVNNKKKKFDNILDTWQSLYDKDKIEFVILEGENSVKEVVDYLVKEDIGLLATVKHNKTFFESIFASSFTKKISDMITVPLLVVHE